MVKCFEISFDDDKYRMSDATSTNDDEYGEVKEVTNLFDFCDINKYSGRGDNSVEYYSRENWAAVSFDMENGAVQLSMTEQMATEIYSQVPEQSGKYNNAAAVPDQYKQAIPTDDVEYPTMGENSGITLIQLKDYDFDDPIWDTFLDQLSWDDLVTICSNGYHCTEAISSVGKPATSDENGPNGFSYAAVYSGTYSKTSYYYYNEQMKGNVDEDGNLILSEIDQDGYSVMTGFPSNGVLAATFNQDLALDVGKAIGEAGLWTGKSGLYGTGLNIHRSPYSGRSSEYYSECGTLTGIMGAAECYGIEEKGVHVYNKHCALNDMEANRHGVGVWVSEQTLREIYLRPFEMSIKEGNAWNVMASFSRFGTYSGAACKELITDFLRGECGMKGIVVTDSYSDMDGSQNCDPYYEHVYGVYYSGCDIPDGSTPKTAGHFEKFSTGYGQMAWQMRAVAKRVCYATLHSNAMNGISVNTEIVDVTPQWQILLYTADAVVGVWFVGSLAWTITASVLDIRKKKMVK